MLSIQLAVRHFLQPPNIETTSCATAGATQATAPPRVPPESTANRAIHGLVPIQYAAGDGKACGACRTITGVAGPLKLLHHIAPAHPIIYAAICYGVVAFKGARSPLTYPPRPTTSSAVPIRSRRIIFSTCSTPPSRATTSARKVTSPANNVTS